MQLAPPVDWPQLAVRSWSSGTTYNLNDAVFYNGSSYVSLQGSNTGNEPDTSASFWSLWRNKVPPALAEWLEPTVPPARPAQLARLVQREQRVQLV